ncbi:hypothetical protein BDV32DRAFT_9252 [Aspergillus pseudonomiae]|uniref:Uncharacterized protein n=1 Tax=Aspergillus pseudonomiae TaxID=1506151 RepID=A0A5N7DRE5_9EURO|nr:uncharacterized protein BDV37DRAFT_238107 [Aspergillus pseudonomiae]KAB8263156.1 hypothetical protein BDV32DRAFT_9252 [Aspergillus pseudonomiae]KAE8408599.1 hypothetical protein BDV37DRAFT_238107 [Aspergillus pseudonomiae]
MTWLSSQTARILLGLLAVAYLFTPVYSLATIPKSKCIKNCGTTPKTTADDLVCPDSAYNNTEKGRTVKDCLLCQSTGTAYINDERNDIYTFLATQKYTVQTCLFDRNGSISGCQNECIPLQSVYKTNWYGGSNFTPIYTYCDDAGFKQYADQCESCLRGRNGSYILANFIDNMVSACTNKPNASEGEIVTLRQPIFQVPASEAVPDESNSSSGLSTGAKAGIGVGVGVGGLMIVGGLAWFFCIRRRSKRVDAHQYERPWQQENADASALSPDPRSGPPSEMPADAVVKGPTELEGEDNTKAKVGGGNEGEYGKDKKETPSEPVELP